MILLLSSNSGDFSFPGIVDWLEYYKADYQILNGEEVFLGSSAITGKWQSQHRTDISGFSLKNVNVVYARRWYQNSLGNISLNDPKLETEINEILTTEFRSFSSFFFQQFKDAYWLPRFNSWSVDKLSVLNYATSCGLSIPDTIITNQKNELLNFFQECDRQIITKAITNFGFLKYKQLGRINPIYTSRISEDFINTLPDSFFPTLFQKEIKKKLEYRVFFLEDKVYSTAILSQGSDETIIDSRSATSLVNAPRMYPCKISDELETKLLKLMKLLGLNIGSIDLLQDAEDNFYFLEVNPVGQFAGYSKACNHDIEKEICELLIKKDNERNEERIRKNFGAFKESYN